MCIEKKMEQLISGELQKIFRISSHTLFIGLTVRGKYSWQEEEEIREDSNSCSDSSGTIVSFRALLDIQDAISLNSLNLHYRTMW